MNPEAQLLTDLDVPIRSFRLYALEQLIQHGSSQETLTALMERKEREEDHECLMLIDHAIAMIWDRVHLVVAKPASSAEGIMKEFLRQKGPERLKIMSRLSSDSLDALGPAGPQLLANETEPMVRAAIIRTFMNVWPAEQLDVLREHLNSPHLSTRIAVLEALLRRDPASLSRELPRLLVREDPRIRSLAVRGLALLDPEDALVYLEALFESGDFGDLLAGLQNSVFFPFERVKPLLLKRLQEEGDLKMMERIGLFLENNPDPEVPYRLWELAEGAEGPRKRLLVALFQKACAKIIQTGVIEEGFQAYQEKLQAWIKNRPAG